VRSPTNPGAVGNALRGVPANRYVIYFSLAALGCSLDLWTKQVVFRWLGVAPFFLDVESPAASHWRGDATLDHLSWLWPHRFGFQTSINTGALFGMGAGYWPLFATLSVLAVVGIIVWLFILRAAHDRWITVALGLVTGGILGNLYDRLGFWGDTALKPEFRHAVRDWILFVWPEIKLKILNPWPNFNIADSLLVTGAIMLVVHAIVWRDEGHKEPKNDG
jgi:signal peptidase II